MNESMATIFVYSKKGSRETRCRGQRFDVRDVEYLNR